MQWKSDFIIRLTNVNSSPKTQGIFPLVIKQTYDPSSVLNTGEKYVSDIGGVPFS